MKFRKGLSTLLVFSFLTCNFSFAQGYYTYQTQATTQVPVQSIVPVNQNYYTGNYAYDNNSYYQVQPQVVTTTVVKQESFAERHPVVTTLGIGALLAGVVTAGVLCSRPEPPRHHHGHKPHHYRG